ncbi:MAG: prephenate dehydrogenase [Dehalobacterium sp.]
MMKQITIIGLGLIGGSFGLALNKKGKISQVVGFDVNTVSIQQAVSKGAVHWGTTNIKIAVEGADLIILAVPVGQMIKMVQEIIPYLKKQSIIFDVGSTKENLVKEISHILPEHIYFMGGHPMAGSERSGMSGANPYLFENAIYVITPREDTDPGVIETVMELIESVGAKPKIMSPEMHDQAVAGVSHLPYFVAVSLVNTVQELSQSLVDAPLLAAGGFRDTTRIAGGDAVMWRDIALSNQENIINMINCFQNQLEITKEHLKHGDGEKLKEMFLKARKSREEIPISYKGVLPQVYELLITIPDQPGMLSLITGSLGKEGVNISEIEVLRVREHQEGAIRLAFQRKEDMEKSMEILKARGLSVAVRS